MLGLALPALIGTDPVSTRRPLPPTSAFKLLFPERPRVFPHRRSIKTTLRTLHIFAGGTLLGGHIFSVPTIVLEPWLWGTVMSGLLLLLTDLHGSFSIVCEVRGVAVLAKLLLVLLVPVFWDARVPLLLSALVIGAVISHMPGRYRHTMVCLRGRVVADQRKG